MTDRGRESGTEKDELSAAEKGRERERYRVEV